MPLRLKSLELHGYKTFASRVLFEFAEGITAIVGPNGSGKSNIADALRWVLGEQSYSVLRAKKTEDMIFSGSEQRPRAGMASATVIFDNSDGWLPVDFTEVSLSRRAYRDGRNEYLLNGQHVRLRDINELLAQSGLAERTYTIIGQGLVDASLALKADERRRLFEEAAGIGLYRSRREEALRRLEITHRNLDRVQDILAELEPRLRSLERQAARAREYAQVQADLRQTLREWYGYHWHRAQQDVAQAMEAVRLQQARLHEVREAYQAARQQYLSFREHLNGLRAQLNAWHRRLAQLHAEREATTGELAALEERRRALFERRQGLVSEQERLKEELRLVREQQAEAETELKQQQQEREEAANRLQLAQTALQEAQAKRLALETDLEAARRALDSLASQRAAAQSRLEDLTVRREKGRARLLAAQETLQEATTRLETLALRLIETTAAQQNAEAAFRKVQSELDQVRRQWTDLEEQLKQTQSAWGARQAERARLQAQSDVLEQAEQSMAGLAEGARFLLEAARQARLNGAQGILAGALEIPAEYEIAIAAALGDYADAVLLHSGFNLDQALDLLEQSGGRASLLPLQELIPSAPLPVRAEEGVLGLAAEVVKAPAELRPAVDLLLGQVFIVRDRQTARRVLTGQPASARAVTLRGEVFHVGGAVLAGKPARVAVLSRPRQRRELSQMLEAVNREITNLESQMKLLQTQVQTVRQEIVAKEREMAEKRREWEGASSAQQQAQVEHETARQQFEWHQQQQVSLETELVQLEQESHSLSKILESLEDNLVAARETVRQKTAALASGSLDDLRQDVTYWTARLAAIEQNWSNTHHRLQERLQTTRRLEARQQELVKRLEELESELEAVEQGQRELRQKTTTIGAQLAELNALIAPAEGELTQAEQQETDLQRQENEAQLALGRVERLYTQLQLDLNRKQEALQSLRNKIEDDFGLVMFEYLPEVSGPVPLPLDGVVEQLPVVTELSPEIEETLNRQRALLRRLGPVNPEAEQEYRAVRERYTFLTEQLADLHRAEADLKQVIAELDDITRREFQKTFEAVAEHFHHIFQRLFGGGSARLTLTNPEDLTETGIEIEARLPGRREQGLSLLSGGERSLTAIALIFALLKVSPTPVCVLDEVDAMLDEANVARFRDLLAELSKKTQFVIITHNRNTVQAADVIYGVTMGRDSTSQVISLRLDEVSEDYLK
ncbi:MAG: chromosome segregation protein SMC [Anaerolineales bacterium]|nr:chromosome segregation protein SMC [Anaerolineales bacterium]